MKKKLNIDELKVQSFITAFEVENGETAEIMGGTGWHPISNPAVCCGGSDEPFCATTDYQSCTDDAARLSMIGVCEG